MSESDNHPHNSNNNSNNNNNNNHPSADYTRINWNPPGTERGDSVSTKNATLALKTAIAVARAFDANCALRNPAKECTIPMFEPQELILGEPLRSGGFFSDIQLRGIKLTRNLLHGEFSEDEEEFRERFAERSIDGHYAVKFLQKGIYNSVHAASAASDMMMETKILMNLAPHPNICQIYGVTAAGSDAFLSRGKEGFYIILDRLKGTMIQRLNEWKATPKLLETNLQYDKVMQRLEVALDVGSALLFLSDRQIVFHLRPDKVGFDVRYGRIKLCDFGQARENGQIDQAPSLTKTDDIRTLAYTAPEVLCQAPVTVAADVYAYGVVLWEMLSLQRPFDGMSRSEHFEHVIMEGERPPLTPETGIPKAVQELIAKCWDPHLRPTMKKVYDTVEEVLLFQDEKPDNLGVLPPSMKRVSSEVIIPTNKSVRDAGGEDGDEDPTMTQSSQNQPTTKSSSKRGVRRIKTEDAPFAKTRDGDNNNNNNGSSSKAEGAPSSKRSSRRDHHHHHHHSSSKSTDHNHHAADASTTEEGAAIKDRSRSSNHEGGGRSSRRSRRQKGESSSNDVSMKDNSKPNNHDEPDVSMKDHSRPMRDDSRDSQASVPMKDRSSKTKERVSRRSRVSRNKSAEGENSAPASAEGGGGEGGDGPKKLPGLQRSATAEKVPPRQRSTSSTTSSNGKGPAFGRSQTTSGARRSRSSRTSS